MGNKNSTDVEIKFDKPAYNPGETINAKIFINSPNKHLCSRIVLHIEGYEESEFRKDIGNKELLNSQNVILRSFFVLKDFKSKKSFLQGQYEYSCEFTLPWTIPGSFNEKKGNYKASIIYHLKAILVSPNGNTNNFQKIKEIVVRQPPKEFDDYQMNKIDIHPECLCFRNLEKNYLPNDDCDVICEIDNSRSKRDIKRVKCEFKRTITLKATNGEKKEIKETLNTVEFQGAKKGMGIIGPLAQKVMLPLRYKNTKIGVLPSTAGQLVRCEYSIEVTPEVGGCFTKGDKTFHVNLQILHPELVQEIQKPDVWQPEVQLMSKFEIVGKNETEMRNSINVDEKADDFAAE